MAKFNDIGILCVNRNEDGFYIKVEKGLKMKITGKRYNGEEVDLEIDGNDFINVTKREDKIRIMTKGDEQKMEEMEERVPAYIKYYLSVKTE